MSLALSFRPMPPCMKATSSPMRSKIGPYFSPSSSVVPMLITTCHGADKLIVILPSGGGSKVL